MIKVDELLRADYGVENEEDTKQRLVLPMLNSLGYDTGFNTKLRYEYCVNGENYGKKVDIVIPYTKPIDSVPKIFIEIKAREKSLWNFHDQIEEYLDLTPYENVLGVLTNGIEYAFFEKNVCGPFFTINFGYSDHYELNIFMKLLGQNTLDKARLSLITKLSSMRRLDIKIPENSYIKLEKMVKILPKEATPALVVDLALNCFDRYFTDEQIIMEFEKMNYV